MGAGVSNNIDIDQAAARQGIADYQFVKMLGAGNHGVFYLARRPERLPVDGEFVAVKVLSGVSGQDTFRRAIRELKAFAAVESPFLVTLYDAGQQGNDLYYAMEYLGGGSLAAPAGRVSRAAMLRAIANAARAAHALHEAGIAHNDIKPSNILLFPGGGKLADLGLSRTLAPGLTVGGLAPPASAEPAGRGPAGEQAPSQTSELFSGLRPGTPIEFIDPALMRGEPPSRISDVYSLGATLHWVLSGTGLYGDLSAGDTLVALRRVLSRPPVISAGLDPAARAVIAAAISEDRSARPSTALEFAGLVEGLEREGTPSPLPHEPQGGSR